MPDLFRHLLNYVHDALFRQEVLKHVQDDKEIMPRTFPLDPRAACAYTKLLQQFRPKQKSPLV